MPWPPRRVSPALPRFAYQRSKTTGQWTTDSVCACWVIWMTDPGAPQFIRYAPEWVIDQLDAETPAYRARMDALMGYTGSEGARREQRKAANGPVLVGQSRTQWEAGEESA